MIAIGMIAVVMMVSGLRVTWRMVRPVRTAVSPTKCVAMVVPYFLLGREASALAVAHDREEDVLEGGLLLDVLDLGGRQQLPELGQGAVDDDPALVQDRDPVGQLLGLVQVLGGEQHGRPALRRAP